MPWIVVLGDGSWTFRVGGITKRLRAGKHEVTEDIAACARERGPEYVVVTDTEPAILKEPGSGPLTPDDVRLGTGIGVKLVEAPVLPELPPDPDAPPLTHACPWCPEKFPNPDVVRRHIEFEHTIRHEMTTAEREAADEAARVAAEEQRRLEEAARTAPEVVHPFERPDDAPDVEGAVPLIPG